MIMGPAWTLSIFFVIWWLVLFAILPLGVRSHVEAGTHVKDGGDPGAPVNPNLKKKAITTTWVAAIVTALVWVVVAFSLMPIPQLPG
jgi:predicted secreted protein